MRELGRRGGKARRKGAGEQLPDPERQSLRSFLRDGLDQDAIKSAIERALSGGNESARVAAVKFLSDLELYGPDDQKGERAKMAEAARGELEALLPRVDKTVRGRLRLRDRYVLDLVLDELREELALERDRAGDRWRIPSDLEIDRDKMIDGLVSMGLLLRGSPEAVDVAKARRQVERDRVEVDAMREELSPV
jgi:hypothetical protein